MGQSNGCTLIFRAPRTRQRRFSFIYIWIKGSYAIHCLCWLLIIGIHSIVEAKFYFFKDHYTLHQNFSAIYNFTFCVCFRLYCCFSMKKKKLSWFALLRMSEFNSTVRVAYYLLLRIQTLHWVAQIFKI